MKIKLVITILILTCLFSGCTTAVLPHSNTEKYTSKPFILGSLEYVKKIQDIAKTSGNRNAFATIMVDVNNKADELDHNDPENLLRFHKLISSLVYKIGKVDIQMHYFRNKLNRVPKSLKALMLLNKSLPVNKRWRLLSIRNSGYHIQGVDGEYNLKFLSPDGFYEAVYNKKGILLDEKNDPVNMGTYNYAAGIPDITAHGRFDVTPYLIWGNTPNSSQKGSADINKGVHLAHLNYIKNAARVYLYRQKLFGMQEGRVP